MVWSRSFVIFYVADELKKAVEKVKRIAQAQQEKRGKIWADIQNHPDPAMANLLKELQRFGQHKAVEIETQSGTWKTGEFDRPRDKSVKIKKRPWEK